MQRAKHSFYASQEGQPERFVRAGDLIADDDSILDGRSDLFEKVELATAPVRHSSPVQKAPKAEPKPEKPADEPLAGDGEDGQGEREPAPAKKAAAKKAPAKRAAKKAPAKKA